MKSGIEMKRMSSLITKSGTTEEKPYEINEYSSDHSKSGTLLIFFIVLKTTRHKEQRLFVSSTAAPPPPPPVYGGGSYQFLFFQPPHTSNTSHGLVGDSLFSTLQNPIQQMKR